MTEKKNNIMTWGEMIDTVVEKAAPKLLDILKQFEMGDWKFTYVYEEKPELVDEILQSNYKFGMEIAHGDMSDQLVNAVNDGFIKGVRASMIMEYTLTSLQTVRSARSRYLNEFYKSLLISFKEKTVYLFKIIGDAAQRDGSDDMFSHEAPRSIVDPNSYAVDDNVTLLVTYFYNFIKKNYGYNKYASRYKKLIEHEKGKRSDGDDKPTYQKFVTELTNRRHEGVNLSPNGIPERVQEMFFSQDEFDIEAATTLYKLVKNYSADRKHMMFMVNPEKKIDIKPMYWDEKLPYKKTDSWNSVGEYFKSIVADVVLESKQKNSPAIFQYIVNGISPVSVTIIDLTSPNLKDELMNVDVDNFDIDMIHIVDHVKENCSFERYSEFTCLTKGLVKQNNDYWYRWLQLTQIEC